MTAPWPLISSGLVAVDTEIEDLEEEMPRGAAEGEIPALHDPEFGAGRWLTDGDELLAVEVDGETRAYPLRILDYHEIVNDEIQGRPIAVTYCPLCGAGVAWDRGVGDRELSFIVSGRLYRNDLVMKDEQTGSLWPQIPGRALHGELAGAQLERVASWQTTWGQFRARHSAPIVLSRPKTNVAIQYESRSHPSYPDRPETLFEPEHEDERLARKDRVFGVARGDDALAIRVQDLAEVELTIETVGGEDVVLADLEDRRIAWWVGDRNLWVEEGHLVGPDGDRWDPTTGRKAGEQLELAHGFSCYWFAWADFHPGSRLWHERDSFLS